MEPSEPNVLPPFITGLTDINRLLRECQKIEDNFQQLKLRQPGSQVKMTKTSLQMDQIINYYKLNLLHLDDRQELVNYLNRVKQHAPQIHMSFSSDPAPQFLEKLLTWLRSNIHPEVLLRVGLQPTIGAGTVIRTTNKYFDFSLAENMKKNKALLLNKIAQLYDQSPASEPIEQEQISE